MGAALVRRAPSNVPHPSHPHVPTPLNIWLSHAYMLTHPGTPCVFWDHYAAPGLGDTVRALMKLRRAHGINARSTVTIVKGTANLYAATVDGKTLHLEDLEDVLGRRAGSWEGRQFFPGVFVG